MIYPCPHCHKYLETERVIKGKAVKLHQCPYCFKQLIKQYKITRCNDKSQTKLS